MAKSTETGGPKKGKIFVTKVNKQEVPFGPGTVGKVASGAARMVSKAITKAGEKGSTKVGQTVGKKIAESTKAPKYPSAAGKKVSTKVEGKITTTSSTGRKVSKPADKVEYTKKAPTEKQRLGSFQAQDTKRTKAIVSGASAAKQASQKIIGKEVAKKNIYKTTTAGLVAKEVYDKKKKK